MAGEAVAHRVRSSIGRFAAIEHEGRVTELVQESADDGFGVIGPQREGSLARVGFDPDVHPVDLLVTITFGPRFRFAQLFLVPNEARTPADLTSVLVVKRTKKEEIVENPGPFAKAAYRSVV